MGSLLDVATRVVDHARGSDEVEVFVTHNLNFSVKAYQGEVETLSSSEPRGAGIRVVSDHRVGFAFTTDMTETGLDAALTQARANARHTTPDEAAGLAPGWTEPPADIPGLVDAGQSDVTADDRVAFAIDLETATRGIDPRVRVVEEAVYSDSSSEVAIATSTGVSGSYRQTDAWCYSVAIATEGDDTQVAFEFDLGRGLRSLSAEGVARRAAERALAVLGARKIPSRRMPVVFDPYVAGQFLGVIAQALTGEAVQKGRSLFAGRIGQEVASGKLTLVDDGRIEGAPGSAPWDGEGVPTQRTEIVKDGVLSSFLYDLLSARREGRESTGNAARGGFKSGPGPAPSNLGFDTTGESRSEVLKRAGNALLVTDFHGVHSGANAVTGDFSVGATGILLENGEHAQPVKEVTIAAPMLQILSGIECVADDRRWLPFGGSFGGATMLVTEMTVAGE